MARHTIVIEVPDWMPHEDAEEAATEMLESFPCEYEGSRVHPLRVIQYHYEQIPEDGE